MKLLPRAFDTVARRRGVFKVETVGDSYVAVTGLPDPQEDHAIIMARFARDCRLKMKEVTRKLELTLGPDTGELTMRFGLHVSITSSVLEGVKFTNTLSKVWTSYGRGSASKCHDLYVKYFAALIVEFQ